MMIPIKKVSPDNTRSYYLILVKASKTTFRQTNNTYIFDVMFINNNWNDY